MGNDTKISNIFWHRSFERNNRSEKLVTQLKVMEKVLLVFDLSRGGAGVARDEEGCIFFIPYTAPEDVVRVRVLRQKKHYGQAQLIEILQPSSLRQKPRCPAFGICGGCHWQHLPYEIQWKTKVEGVLQGLRRSFGDECSVEVQKIPAESVWEYRNRIQLRGDQGQLGFFQSGSRTLVPVHRCDIAHPAINASWKDFQLEGEGRGNFKLEVEVEGTEVRRTWNEPHAGRGFRQVHEEQNVHLQSWVAGCFRSFPGAILYDLYGGSGNLSSGLVATMSAIHCVDISIHRSDEPGVFLHRAPVVPWIERAFVPFQEGKRVAILDPPRGGLGRDLEKIHTAFRRLGISELVAIGCHTDAWLRDLGGWQKNQWTLEKVLILDLFPQTYHVECGAYLRFLG
jgi:23S rRNA (uracil1939-C5)-methyltransferase